MTGRNWWQCRASERAAAGVLLALALVTARAQAPTAEAAPEPAAAAARAVDPASAAGTRFAVVATGDARPTEHYDHGTLWRIHAATGAVGHLLGTIHIGQARELAVPPQTWSLLLTANRLVVELAPGSVDVAQLERLQRLPPGESIARQLGAAQMQRLQARLASAGLALRGPQFYRPWVLTQLLQAASPLTLETLDDRLVWQARQQRLAVLSLETLQEQLAAFDCISPAEQLLLLKDTLAMPDGFFESLNRDALALYRARRTGALVALLAERFPVDAAAREATRRATQCIIGDRNQRFAQRLQPLLADNGVFAAIGAAHLVGPGGVLAQLAAAGFKIERIDTVNLPSRLPEDKQ